MIGALYTHFKPLALLRILCIWGDRFGALFQHIELFAGPFQAPHQSLEAVLVELNCRPLLSTVEVRADDLHGGKISEALV